MKSNPDIYRRRGELIRLSFSAGLTDNQRKELNQINACLDEADRKVCAPAIDRLESIVLNAEYVADSIRAILDIPRSDR